jgi:hypothetical protein
MIDKNKDAKIIYVETLHATSLQNKFNKNHCIRCVRCAAASKPPLIPLLNKEGAGMDLRLCGY